MGEIVQIPKAAFLTGVGYEIHEQVVVDFHESNARIRVPVAPARTSKSWGGAYDFLSLCIPHFEKVGERLLPRPHKPGNPDIVCWIVAPDFKLAKEFKYIWQEIVHRGCFDPFGGKVVQKQNNPNQGHMRIEVNWGVGSEGDDITTIIEVKSARNPESCQSEEVYVCLMSEAADQDAKMWETYLHTRVQYLIAPTTPKISGYWLYKLIEFGKENPEIDVEAFQFTPHCNPTYDWERFQDEHAKAEARVTGEVLTVFAHKGPVSADNGHDCFDPNVKCRAAEDLRFAEQALGRWTFEGGKVLPFRRDGPNAHVLDAMPPWVPYGRLYVSTDYGYSDPGVALWWSVGSDGQICLYRELYETNLDPQDFVDRIQAMSNEADEQITAYLADPQKPEVKSFMRKLGLPLYSPKPGAMRDRRSGGMRLVDALTPDIHTGLPKLHVLSEKAGEGLGCPRTIHEWAMLRRKEDFTGDEWSDSGFIGRDDAYDAARYFFAAKPHGNSAFDETSDSQFDLWMEQARESERRAIFNQPFSSSIGAA